MKTPPIPRPVCVAIKIQIFLKSSLAATNLKIPTQPPKPSNPIHTREIEREKHEGKIEKVMNQGGEISGGS